MNPEAYKGVSSTSITQRRGLNSISEVEFLRRRIGSVPLLFGDWEGTGEMTRGALQRPLGWRKAKTRSPPKRPAPRLRAPHWLTCGDGPALYFVCPPCEVSEGFDTTLQVDEKGMKERLPRVHGLQGLQGQDMRLRHSFLFTCQVVKNGAGQGKRTRSQNLDFHPSQSHESLRKPDAAFKNKTCPRWSGHSTGIMHPHTGQWTQG